MNKTAIRNFAIWARNKLIADVSYRAGLMGITKEGISDALPQSTSDVEFYDIGTAEPYTIHNGEIKQRKSLVEIIRQKERNSDYTTAYSSVMEEVAYTWFNRLIAVRFMEVNDYMPSHVRVLSSETGKLEPDLVTTPFDAELGFLDAEKQYIIQLKNENKLDEAFRLLFIKQCNCLYGLLPRLFENTSDYSELLLNVSFVDQDGVVYHLVHDIDEDDFNIEKGGQVEIIGWLYQYYNSEPKSEAFLKKGKLNKREIPAVTQLFTPDWIVRYMVENSVGVRICEVTGKNIGEYGWKYLVTIPRMENDGIQKAIKEFKIIDPSMGSGHVLVYAFDVLMQVYLSLGYSEREAANSIIINNIYGLDIDDRAGQLAYFAVMMKARQYNRRALNGDVDINVLSIKESIEIDNNSLSIIDTMYIGLARKVIELFRDAKEYGSVLNMPFELQELLEFKGYLSKLIDSSVDNIVDMISVNYIKNEVIPLLNQAIIFCQKYDVVVTNPPYLGNAPEKLQKYLQEYYEDEKYDLYAAFMEKGINILNSNGILAYVTGESWMFLPSFVKMREKLLSKTTIESMLHLGVGAFDAGFGTTSFVLRKQPCIGGQKGIYYRLAEYKTAEDKIDAFLNNKSRYSFIQENYKRIEGSPIAYWMKPKVLDAFGKKDLGDVATTKSGIVTGDNEKFMRLWFETAFEDVTLGTKVADELPKWVPAHKGGGSLQYYGNHDYIMRLADLWDPKFAKSNMRRGDKGFYFREGMTWSTLSNKLAFRYSPEGFVYETKGSMCFANEKVKLKYILGLLNSIVCLYVMDILAPTLDYNRSSLLKTPFIYDESKKMVIDDLVDQNIQIAKNDWDSFETSWDFKKNPLV